MDGATFPPHRITKSKIYCYVNGCNSIWNKNLNVRFHHLPKAGERFVFVENIFGNLEKVDQLKAWQIALKLKSTCTKSVRVCSLHFKKSDYLLPDIQASRRFLKRNAVPSCNLPGRPVLQTNQLRRCIKRSESVEKLHQPSTVESVKLENADVELENADVKLENAIVKLENAGVELENAGFELEYEDVKMEDAVSSDEAPVCSSPNKNSTISMNNLDLSVSHDSTISVGVDFSSKSNPSILTDQSNLNSTGKSLSEIGVQVNTGFLSFTIVDLLQTNSQLSTATGIESFETLDVIVNIVRRARADKPQQNNCKISLRDKIILTYMKLKQNCSYSYLAILFRCTSKHVQRIFSSMVNILGECLKPLILWPAKGEISRNNANGPATDSLRKAAQLLKIHLLNPVTENPATK